MNINPKCAIHETIIKITGAYAPATIRAYKRDFENFIDYCSENDLPCLPSSSDTVAHYIDKLSDSKHSSAYIRRILAGISTIHKLNYLVDPTSHPEVKLAMRRMHRKLGRFAHQAKGVNRELLERLIKTTDNSLIGKRDRALLLLAYDTLGRRSELTSLRIEDIQLNNNGATILLRKSKTDQDAQGKWLNISLHTYDAITSWIASANIQSGYIIRGIRKGNLVRDHLEPGQISRILKRLCKQVGLNEAQIKNISGHSMRVGAAQDLLLAGASLPMIMAKGRWSKTDTVMRYIENTSSLSFDQRFQMAGY